MGEHVFTPQQIAEIQRIVDERARPRIAGVDWGAGKSWSTVTRIERPAPKRSDLDAIHVAVVTEAHKPHLPNGQADTFREGLYKAANMIRCALPGLDAARIAELEGKLETLDCMNAAFLRQNAIYMKRAERAEASAKRWQRVAEVARGNGTTPAWFDMYSAAKAAEGECK